MSKKLSIRPKIQNPYGAANSDGFVDDFHRLDQLNTSVFRESLYLNVFVKMSTSKTFEGKYKSRHRQAKRIPAHPTPIPSRSTNDDKTKVLLGVENHGPN